jgi:NAD(P)-dependent dehydrogenase (short-subunit alcohol dehydrogenase family)
VSGRNLEGRVAIITGGGGAIGSATAERMARAGALVAVADIREGATGQVADRLQGEGLTVEAFKVDLREAAQIRTLVDDVVRRFGRIDILHNNAAAIFDKGDGADLTLLDVSAEVWDATFAVNVRAPMLLSKYVIEQMRRQGASQIASPEARTAYGSSKAALETLTRYVAAQYGPQNIRCNAILPGVVLTKGMEVMFTAEQLDAMVGRTMLKRICLPEDIAAMAHFLVSDDARQITGELVRVNGGNM